MSSPDDDRPVGYRRPPAGRRFAKGASGNPNGRPRKARSLGKEIDEALSETVEIKEKGQRRTVTKRRAAAKQLANASASGDLRAIKLAADMAAKADPGALEANAPLTKTEAEIAERLIARIRDGWKLAQSDA
jgi:hypothetical protein